MGGKIMILGELMPDFGKFHCDLTIKIDGITIYKGITYPIAVDVKRCRVRISVKNNYLFSTLDELEKFGRIEI